MTLEGAGLILGGKKASACIIFYWMFLSTGLNPLDCRSN